MKVLSQWMNRMARISGAISPRPTSGQVAGRVRAQVQQHEPGEAEHQAGTGENVDEPAPGRAGVAALYAVVEVGDPAARRDFMGGEAGLALDRQPGITPAVAAASTSHRPTIPRGAHRV